MSRYFRPRCKHEWPPCWSAFQSAEVGRVRLGQPQRERGNWSSSGISQASSSWQACTARGVRSSVFSSIPYPPKKTPRGLRPLDPRKGKKKKDQRVKVLARRNPMSLFP